MARDRATGIGIAMVLILVMPALTAQSNRQEGSVRDFIRVDAPVVVLEHLLVIDGTGAPARADQTVVISRGKISAIGDSASVEVPARAQRIDFTGHTAIPGLVGMHDHLFYVTSLVNDNYVAHSMPLSFPRLFLGAGVTSIRTTGSYEPYTDLEIKKAVDNGKMVGPKNNVTGRIWWNENWDKSKSMRWPDPRTPDARSIIGRQKGPAPSRRTRISHEPS